MKSTIKERVSKGIGGPAGDGSSIFRGWFEDERLCKGAVVCRTRMGGLLKHYERRAAWTKRDHTHVIVSPIADLSAHLADVPTKSQDFR